MIKLKKFNVCIYPTPSSQTGSDTRSIFKQSIYGLNSKMSFAPKLVDLKKSIYSTILLITGWENRWIHAFPKGISIKWNANSHTQYLNLDHQFHLLK